MSVVLNPQKYSKKTNAESESHFDPSAIPFIPKELSLKLNIVSSKDMIEWEKKLHKVIKCKSVGNAEGMFDLVGGVLEGYTLTQ
eukprot:6218604-Ditylum_brightwellii.AAC.1